MMMLIMLSVFQAMIQLYQMQVGGIQRCSHVTLLTGCSIIHSLRISFSDTPALAPAQVFDKTVLVKQMHVLEPQDLLIVRADKGNQPNHVCSLKFKDI